MEIVATDHTDIAGDLLIRPATGRSSPSKFFLTDQHKQHQQQKQQVAHRQEDDTVTTIEEEGQEALLVEPPPEPAIVVSRSLFGRHKKKQQQQQHRPLLSPKSTVKLIEPTTTWNAVSTPVDDPVATFQNTDQSNNAVQKQQKLSPQEMDVPEHNLSTKSSGNEKTTSHSSVLVLNQFIDTARELLQQASLDGDMVKTELAFARAFAVRKSVESSSAELDMILDDALSKAKSAMEQDDLERTEHLLDFLLDFVLPDKETVERLYGNTDEVSSLGFDKSFEEALKQQREVDTMDVLSMSSLNEILDGPLTPTTPPLPCSKSEPPPTTLCHENRNTNNSSQKRRPRLFAKFRSSSHPKKTPSSSTLPQPTIVVDDGVSDPVIITTTRTPVAANRAPHPLSHKATYNNLNNSRAESLLVPDRRSQTINVDDSPGKSSTVVVKSSPSAKSQQRQRRHSPLAAKKMSPIRKESSIATPVVMPFVGGNSLDETLDMEDGILSDQQDTVIPPPPSSPLFEVDNESSQDENDNDNGSSQEDNDDIESSLEEKDDDEDNLSPASGHSPTERKDSQVESPAATMGDGVVVSDIPTLPSNEIESFIESDDDDDKYTTMGEEDDEDDQDSAIMDDRYSVMDHDDPCSICDTLCATDDAYLERHDVTNDDKVKSRNKEGPQRSKPKKPLEASQKVRRRRLKLFRKIRSSATTTSQRAIAPAKKSSTMQQHQPHLQSILKGGASRTGNSGQYHQREQLRHQPELVSEKNGLVVKRPQTARPLKPILRPPRLGNPSSTEDTLDDEDDDENPLLLEHIRRKRGIMDPQPVDRLQLDP